MRRPDLDCDVEAARPDDRIRLAELMVALSLATDLGLGRPLEHELREPTAAMIEALPNARTALVSDGH
jgi:hypothetical protein